jgi:PAS domain S-box-containing protein/putative nucleotidyltransferase with HDIG domain
MGHGCGIIWKISRPDKVMNKYFIVIVFISIILQLLAAGFALRLVRLTGRITAWALIAAAISCMAIRRGYTLYESIFGGMSIESADFTSEVIAMFTSALMVVGVALIAPMIVAMQEADATIRRSEERFRSLVTNIPAIVFTGYADGSVDFFNHRVEAITGYLRELFDSRRLKWLDLVLPEDLEEAKGVLIQALKGDKAYVREYRIRSKDGKAIWIQERSHIVLTPDRKIDQISGVFFDITARKEMEAMLQVSEARFRAFMEHSPAVAFMKDAEGHYIYINGACERMTQRKVGEWLGKTDFEVFPAEIAARHHESDLSVLTTNAPVQLISSVPAAGGNQTHWAVFKFPVPDVPDRGIIGGMAVDITERLLAEANLLKEKVISDTIINSMPGIFYFFDDRGRYLRWNSNFERVTGYSGEEISQLKPLDMIDEADRNLIESSIQEVLLQGDVLAEAHLLLKDGSKIPYLFTGRRITLEGNDFVLGMGVDVSQLKRAEAALRESEANYRNIFENAVEGIFQTTPEGRFLSANPAMAQMLGFSSPQEMIATVTDIGQYHADPERRPLFKRLLEAQGAVQGFEIPYNRQDGTRIWTSINARLVRNPQGETYYEGFIVDITARKQIEEALFREKERYRILADEAPLGIAIIGKDGNYQYLNQKFVEIFGYNLEDLPTGSDWFAKAFPDEAYREQALSAWVQDLKTSKPGESRPRTYVVTCKDDSKKIINFRPVTLQNGDQLVIYEDITARQTAEDSLKQSYEKLQKTLRGIVKALATAVEMRDPYTAGHQQQVVRLACAMAREMGLAEEQIEGLSVAGALHDIGKINIPAEILSKPGKLSEIEFEIIKTHAQVGFAILRGIDFPWPVAAVIAQHHERMDGSGYPFGLPGPDILLEARILAVADVVEAMASHRPYRPALGIEKALEEISRNRGVLYDSEVVDACIRVFTEKGFTL